MALPDWVDSALQLLQPGAFGAIDPIAGVGGIERARSFLFPGQVRVSGRRHRRRRALTNSDRADIAFIAATISKQAAGTFAAQLAARSR
jgi:hypothetical protein